MFEIKTLMTEKTEDTFFMEVMNGNMEQKGTGIWVIIAVLKPL